jgi:hypothetical protein
MCEWFSNYALPLQIDKDKLNEYIISLKKNIVINENDILENKVEQIENDYLTKLKILEVECSNLKRLVKCRIGILKVWRVIKYLSLK